ncbi:HSP20-like chaperones superfamily protein [Raphanus sativus]|uniref:Protein RESTRICTED TEV MOVEMENT 2 n=1 Tax=Raphanus sativus TaxID=3726 RepID=A0A6J0NW79_RAPSA|nr:protein RESTRICTED TEV MOVEMENT 2 [Raphanus sativus]KAJ4893307.1 HSP20-like chaperones superfamily protein [Raphanus sativus]
MLRRQRPGGGGGGRHPPPLAPTVSNFKPRAQWSTLESSMFLNINLPGFYMDQIKITKDERTRTINIEGQRPLSTQTKARFKEVYRVPESCDMTKLSTSFSHGLLTIEFPVVVESEKAGKVANDKGNRGTGPDGSSVRRSRLSDKENQVGTSQEKAGPTARKEEPKTYKSVLEGKREVPAANRVKTEQKVKEGESSPSLGHKEHAKQEKVVEKKEFSQMGQQKTVQKLKDEEARGRPTGGGSLKAKVPAHEEKVTERNKDGDYGKKKTEQKVKEEGDTKTPTNGGSLGHKVLPKAEKVVERKGHGETGQKLKEEGKTGLGQKKEEKHTKPAVGDEAKTTEKEISALNQAKPELKTKEERARNVNGNMITKNDEKMVGDKVSRGEIQEGGGEKKVEETGLVKETRDLKDNPQVLEPTRVDSGSPVNRESTTGGEDREKMVEKSSGSETVPLLAEGQKETKVDPPAAEGSGLEREESHKDGVSLVNVGVASLVIMVFGAYVFVPLVKMFY